MTLSATGFQFIRDRESFEPRMYRDVSGHPTIGYGTLIDSKAEQHLLTATITRQQGEELLRRDVGVSEKYINQQVKMPLNQGQFDALVSLVYNIGPGNFLKSRVLKLVNQHPGDGAIRAAFLTWNTSGGKVYAGLTARRKAEADMYFSAGGHGAPAGGSPLPVAVLALLALVLGGSVWLLYSGTWRNLPGALFMPSPLHTVLG